MFTKNAIQVNKDIVLDLQKKDFNLYLFITGGGTEVIGEMLRYGGSSSFFVGSSVLYSQTFLKTYVQNIDKSCSLEVSEKLASIAATCAKSLGDSVKKNNIGLALTASLKKDNERDGRENKAFLSICFNHNFIKSFKIELDKKSTREEQEAFCCDYILQELRNLLNEH